MSVFTKIGSKEFAVVHRWLDDEDVMHVRLLALITDAPDGVTVPDLKGLIDSIGERFLEGITEDQINWDQGYKVAPADAWDEKIKEEVARLERQAARVDEDYEGTPYISDPENDDVPIFLDTDHRWFCRRVTYASLRDSLKGEKRITLRLPIGLHSALARASYGYESLNSFCIRTLASAVDYSEIVDEFEAQRRKPGRPKKIEASN